MAIQMLRASTWRHMKGTTLGGQEFETILCSSCAKDEHKRKRTKETIEQEELPLDFESGRIVTGKQGFASR